MTGNGPDNGEVWRDRLIGDPDAPVPDPWFIRELRTRQPSGAADAPAVGRAAAPRDFEPLDAADTSDAGPAALDEPAADVSTPRRRISPLILAALGVLALLLLWLFATPRVDGPSPEKRDAMGVDTAAPLPTTAAAASSTASLQCAQPRTLGRLREIVATQAQNAAGGGDVRHFQQLAAGLSLSVTGTPVETNGGGAESSCKGWLTLQVPLDASGSNVATSPMVVPVRYSVRAESGAAASVFGLEGAGPLVEQLTRSAAVAPAEDLPMAPSQSVPLPSPVIPPRAPSPQVQPRETEPRVQPPMPEPAAPTRRVLQRTSFDCGRVTSRVNEMICTSPELAALDRRMSRLYYQLEAGLDDDARRELDDTRNDFLRRKQRCDDEACIADVYADRIDELEGFVGGDQL